METTLTAHAEAANRSPSVPIASASRTISALATLCLAAMLMLGGCADKRGGTIPYGVAKFDAPDPIAAISVPGSHFSIRIWTVWRLAWSRQPIRNSLK